MAIKGTGAWPVEQAGNQLFHGLALVDAVHHKRFLELDREAREAGLAQFLDDGQGVAPVRAWFRDVRQQRFGERDGVDLEHEEAGTPGAPIGWLNGAVLPGGECEATALEAQPCAAGPAPLVSRRAIRHLPRLSRDLVVNLACS